MPPVILACFGATGNCSQRKTYEAIPPLSCIASVIGITRPSSDLTGVQTVNGKSAPGIRVRDGRIVELDGKPEGDFDMLDRFIALHAIDAATAEACMSVPPLQIARMLVDFQVSREQVVAMFRGLTPARIVEVAGQLNAVEMMMALQKMRARRTPSN